MKRIAIIFSVLVCVITFSVAARSQSPVPTSKKQQLVEIENTLSESQKKLAEMEARIKELNALMAEAEILKKNIEQQQQLADKLSDDLADEEEKAFQESSGRTVLDVASFDTYLIDFNGTPKWVTLHGVKVNNDAIPLALLKTYKKKLVKKKLFVRCADGDCGKVYLYDLKTSPTLNVLLIINGAAVATEDALFDVVKYAPHPNPTSTSTSTYSSGSSAGTDVSVRGYYRKDGTYVRPHTRSSPGRRR